MRVVVQRVSRAAVLVGDEQVGAIGGGLCLLVGVEMGDDARDAEVIAEKVAGLRVFADDQGRMNLSLVDVGGEALVISQFTLIADVRRGRRPSFTEAARPEDAAPLVGHLADMLADLGVPTARGVFGARMAVSLVNDGPVTIVMEVRNGAFL
jgi:D-tyrosyl-tRNA(Tyr) deacylase